MPAKLKRHSLQSRQWVTSGAQLRELIGVGGKLVVTRDVGLENQYQGQVPIVSGEVDSDIEHYLNVSEQLPSVMVCEVVLDGHGRCAAIRGNPLSNLSRRFPTTPGADPRQHGGRWVV